MLRPILEYVSACWDPCKRQSNELHRVQKKAVQFTNHTKDSDLETLAERRTIARLCALFIAFCREWAWVAILDRVRGAYCLCWFGHVRNIRNGKQRTDIGKYSFLNTNIKVGT